MVEAKLWGALSASIGGSGTVSIEARDIRELFRKLAQDYPAVGPDPARASPCRSTGSSTRDSWSTRLPEDAEIFLLPRMAGG